VLLALVAVCLAPVMWFQLHAYQRGRITGVLFQSDEIRERIIEEPEKYAFLGTPRQAREWEVGIGMQLVRSKVALGSGGLMGNGWGEGTFVEYNFLPDKHNDFIFAIVGHQWGLVGCLRVLGCYAIIVIAGMEIAACTIEPFGRLLVVGVVALIATQVIINVGMTVGLMPITGMTLPFVSYGGSSLLTNFLGLGFLVSVSRHRPYILADRPFEFGRAGPPDTPIKPAPTFRRTQ
jgi:rod shape determining protein RodA